MKWQGILFVIVLVVGIVVAAAVGESYNPRMHPHSSKNPDPEGCLAFFLLLNEYTDVKRLETFTDLDPGTLLMIDPVQLSSDEKAYLLKWVEQGNRLIVFSDDMKMMWYFGAALSESQRTHAVVAPELHWSTENVEFLDVVYTMYFSSLNEEVIASDGDQPLIIEVNRGEGDIFLVSTLYLVENGHIDKKDNEIFLVQLSLSDTVYFDEYHLYELRKEREASIENVKATFTFRYRSFFIQLILVIALFLIVYGKRFGVARSEPPREVQSSELVVSAADLYYKAGKKEVLEIIPETESLNNTGKKKMR